MMIIVSQLDIPKQGFSDGMLVGGGNKTWQKYHRYRLLAWGFTKSTHPPLIYILSFELLLLFSLSQPTNRVRAPHMGHWLSNLFTTLGLAFEKYCEFIFMKVKLNFSLGEDMQSYD